MFSYNFQFYVLPIEKLFLNHISYSVVVNSFSTKNDRLLTSGNLN